MNREFYNAEGYPDPTAYRAISSRSARWHKAKFLVAIFLFITKECGFFVTTRIELRDMQTGELIK